MNLFIVSICYLLSILVIMAVYKCLTKLKIHLNGFVDAMFQFIPPAGVAIFVLVAITWVIHSILFKLIYYFNYFS